MHRPGAKSSTHWPVSSALEFDAQKSMEPQLTVVVSPMPRNDRPDSARIAEVAAPKKLPVMSDVMFGRISRKTMRAAPSPENCAAVMKSRPRIDWVWDRSTRAP